MFYMKEGILPRNKKGIKVTGQTVWTVTNKVT